MVIEDDQNEEVCCNSTYTGSNVVSMCVVPVRIKHRTNKVLETYAMFDSCNESTFMDKQLLDELQILCRKTTITVKTLNDEATELMNNATKNLCQKRFCSEKLCYETKPDCKMEIFGTNQG